MQNGIPSEQALAWVVDTAAAAAAAAEGYIFPQQVPGWAPEPAENTHTQPIQAWVPDHSNSFSGRPWKPQTADAGALARAQKTDAVVCEPSFDETAVAEAKVRQNAKLNAEAEAREKASLYCLAVKRAREAAKKEGARRIENARVPVSGTFSDEDIILDYTGDWDLTSSDEDSEVSLAS